MEAGILYCASSGKSLLQEEAVFLTTSPDGALIFDMDRKLPGPHLCLECRRNVIIQAMAQGILQNIPGSDIKIPDDFADKAMVLLRRRAHNMLCMARKSGALTYGFEKVMTDLKAGRVEFLLQACDGKEGGKHKTGLNAGDLRIFSVFTSSELGNIVSRGRIVHMAALKGNANMLGVLIAAITRIEKF